MHLLNFAIQYDCICTCLLVLLRALLQIFITGTLGYVMSEVEDGKPLSEVVKAAKNLGFTEPGLYVIFFSLHANPVFDKQNL